MKIITKIILSLVFILSLTACGTRNLPTDKALDDGRYFYRNNLLGFSLILPKTFEHYQTQRAKGSTYTDLEIFVPTSDDSFGKQIPGYAKPVEIRVFDKDAWKNTSKQSSFKFLGEKKDKVFTILFWKKVPKDWQESWTEDVENSIINSFAIE